MGDMPDRQDAGRVIGETFSLRLVFGRNERFLDRVPRDFQGPDDSFSKRAGFSRHFNFRRNPYTVLNFR